MTPAQVMQYVGLGYADNGFGPDQYNCWGLLRHIEAEFFDRHLPLVPIGDTDATRDIHEQCLIDGLYRPLEHAEDKQHGDAALLRQGDAPHVGIYLDIDKGGILHAMGGVGVIWTPLRDLNRLGFGRVKYYRIQDARALHSPEGSLPPND